MEDKWEDKDTDELSDEDIKELVSRVNRENRPGEAAKNIDDPRESTRAELLETIAYSADRRQEHSIGELMHVYQTLEHTDPGITEEQVSLAWKVSMMHYAIMHGDWHRVEWHIDELLELTNAVAAQTSFDG